MLYAHLELFCGVMNLITDVKNGGNDEFTNHVAWDLKLCAAYYDVVASAAVSEGEGGGDKRTFLLKPIFIKTMIQHVRDFALAKDYAHFLRDGTDAEITAAAPPKRYGYDRESVLDDDRFGAFCILNDMPWQLSLGVADVNSMGTEACTEDMLLLKLGAL